MKKGKWMLLVFLFLCCIGGCARSGKKEEMMDGREEAQVQEEGSEDSQKTQTPGDTAEAGTEFSGGEADSGESKDDFSENGEPLEGIIQEQSFEVELDGWGTVTFLSIAPGNAAGAPRFALAKEGAVVYAFPEGSERKACDFVEVSAVSFADYNGDGKKDVIVLIAYRNGSDIWKEAEVFLQENSDNMFYLDYPDLESYRMDAPSEKGPAFYRDGLLEEYLLTQRLTDQVSLVMGTWTDYIDYVDSLRGYLSSDRQLMILAENRDSWAIPMEYANERYFFTIRDLNYDGRFELIVANQGGTGHYTTSRFYGIDEAGNLKELHTFFVEGDSQPDLIEEQMTVYRSFSPEGMRDHYIVYDEIKMAPDCYVYRISSLCMTDDYIMETPLATQTLTYEGEEYTAHTVSEDCNGNALTEEEFWNFADAYYSSMGLRKETVSLHWMDVNELVGKSDDEAAQLLRQAYSRG